MTRNQFAKKAKIGLSTLYELEKDEGNPSIETLILVADALGRPLSQILLLSEMEVK